jgi:hypothetical protein
MTLLSKGDLTAAQPAETVQVAILPQVKSKATTIEGKPSTAGAETAGAGSRFTKDASKHPTAALRDPFRPNPTPRVPGALPTEKLQRPPGIAGLVIGELQLHGLIEEKSSHRMVAVVTDGGTLAYFLHESDRLYDGTVSQITPTALYLSRKAMPSGASPTGSVVLRLQSEPGDKP